MKKSYGFNLIELLVVVSLVGILLTIAVPSMRDFILSNRLTSQANGLVTSINLARSAAISQGVTTHVTAAGGTAGNEWFDGWTVWADTNRNGALDAGEELRVTEALSGTTTLDSSGIVDISFAPQGLLNAGAGSITICDDRSGETGRQITILVSGRISMDSEYSCS